MSQEQEQQEEEFHPPYDHAASRLVTNKMSKDVKDQVFYFFPLPPHLFSSSDTIRNSSLFPLNQSLNFLPSTLFLHSL